MKNKLLYLIFSLLFINVANCEIIDTPVYDAYRYVSFGVGPIVVIPNVGIGYRERHGEKGWDTSLSFSTIGYAHQLTAHAVGHYYLSPYQPNSAYLGLGILGSYIITNHGDSIGTLSPDFVFGKELADSKHFIEMHVAVPSLCMGGRHQRALYIPLMYIKYGISF